MNLDSAVGPASGPGTVLVVFSNTGGGHRAAALSLDRAMHMIEPGVDVVLRDVLFEDGSVLLRRLVSLYPAIIRHSPALWGGVYHVSNTGALFAALQASLGGHVRRSLSARLSALDPDIIVSVHPLLNHVSRLAIQQSGRPRGLVTVVTDLVDVHRGWALPSADEIIVPTEEARRAVLRRGVAERQVKVLGLPVDSRFRPPRPGERCELRRQYSLDVDRPTVLVTGGGEGSGGLLQQTEALTSRPYGWQVVVVCGRNEKLRQRLLELEFGTRTVILGFVDAMPELLRTADVVVGKAGPGTIAEALATGVPVILTSYLPGQETHNVDFVRSTGCGIYAPGPKQLLETVQRILVGDSAELRLMAQRAAAALPREAALAIARECMSVAASYRMS